MILAHAPDYHVNLIAPKEMSDGEINEFHSNLREVMLYIKYSKNKKELHKIIENDSNFQSMERQTADVINVVTGSKLSYPEGKEAVNMCLAIQQMREESEIKGAILMCKNLGVSLTSIIIQPKVPSNNEKYQRFNTPKNIHHTCMKTKGKHLHSSILIPNLLYVTLK